jgi:hypothetical protein
MEVGPSVLRSTSQRKSLHISLDPLKISLEGFSHSIPPKGTSQPFYVSIVKLVKIHEILQTHLQRTSERQTRNQHNELYSEITREGLRSPEIPTPPLSTRRSSKTPQPDHKFISNNISISRPNETRLSLIITWLLRRGHVSLIACLGDSQSSPRRQYPELQTTYAQTKEVFPPNRDR